MAFRAIQQPVTEFNYLEGLNGISDRLRAELPGHPESFYVAMRRSIIEAAMSTRSNVAAVCDSFIIGALNR